MTYATAVALWGEDAVALALAEPNPDAQSAELASAIRTHADPPGAFRAWALAQPWPRFCAIVRVVSGRTRSFSMAGDLEKQLGLRVTLADIDRMNALAERLGQGSHAVARAALRIGFAALERDAAAFVSPDALAREAPKPRKRGA